MESQNDYDLIYRYCNFNLKNDNPIQLVFWLTISQHNMSTIIQRS